MYPLPDSPTSNQNNLYFINKLFVNILDKEHLLFILGLLGAYKPQCAEDGKFQKVQCHSSTGHCWCAHPVTGEKTSESQRGKPKC